AWPAVFPFADHSLIARSVVHASGLGGGSVCPSCRARLVPAIGNGMGTSGRRDCRAICRSAYRGGHQAGLSRHTRAAGTHPTRACGGAGARALATWRVSNSEKLKLRLLTCPARPWARERPHLKISDQSPRELSPPLSPPGPSCRGPR